jgi:putative transposase
VCVIYEDTHAHVRHLPHLEKEGRTYFVTAVTRGRVVLPPAARDVVLACILHDHRVTCWLQVAVVMPDHAHWILTPIGEWTLPKIMRRIKGNSSRLVNRDVLGRTGAVWQDESFDRMLRRDEDLRAKCEYVAMNPVRANLVETPDEYKWLWRQWLDDV